MIDSTPLEDPSDAAIAATVRKDSLIVYPTQFPIKVMGTNVEALLPAMLEIARRFDPGFDAASIELRPSRAGRYMGVTLTVNATSREQLDALYLAFTSHPLVKVVL
ncbi:MAG: YbeD family protein [Giesbergeria sp.]